MDLMLYCFISHNAKIVDHSIKIYNIMSKLYYNDYIIVYGGEKKLTPHPGKIIHLDCDDSYEGLPDKIHKMSKFLINNSKYNIYSHFCKSDATGPIQQLVPLIKNYDYYGVLTGEEHFSRKYHLNKCSNQSKWNKQEYQGEFVPYCLGGCYVLSRKSLEIISNSPNDKDKDIYEDLYVGQKLNKYQIYPKPFNIKQYLLNNEW